LYSLTPRDLKHPPLSVVIASPFAGGITDAVPFLDSSGVVCPLMGGGFATVSLLGGGGAIRPAEMAPLRVVGLVDADEAGGDDLPFLEARMRERTEVQGAVKIAMKAEMRKKVGGGVEFFKLKILIYRTAIDLPAFPRSLPPLPSPFMR
jgi:hypothetical protein